MSMGDPWPFVVGHATPLGLFKPGPFIVKPDPLIVDLMDRVAICKRPSVASSSRSSASLASAIGSTTRKSRRSPNTRRSKRNWPSRVPLWRRSHKNQSNGNGPKNSAQWSSLTPGKLAPSFIE